MLDRIASIWISSDLNPKSPEVRRKYGIFCGILGIIFNLLLFAIKLFAGLVSASVAITADAINNLSDGASSLVTIIGFRLAGKKPDPEHPFGHGRLEYVSGMIVSLAILLMGAELFIDSVDKILHPTLPQAKGVVYIILIASILTKLYMAYYNRHFGKKIDSASIRAVAWDCLSDCAATLMVLLSTLLADLFSLRVDGWCGALVSILIFIAGLRAAQETLYPLLGQPPSPELVADIEKLVLENPEILRIHDLVVHDYGVGRTMVSLHAEVSCHADVIVIHDIIDNVERDLADRFSCEAVIHMDPVDDEDSFTLSLREKVMILVSSIDESITIHDFRVVRGPTHTNLIFDAVVPYGLPWSDEAVSQKISQMIRALDSTYYTVVKIDKNYTGI
ncbi:MAG: cation transporter [Clostridia bacterium]|nr:cation transporter [Clostridia bacterium]